ncbi:MAG: F0F1 ATP synthase subunit epsilon [Acidimicrobiales bacterium]
MANTNVEIVTPSGSLFSGEAEMVVCRTAGGEIGFLANHMPYLGLLEPGVVRVVGATGSDREAGASPTGSSAAGGEIRMAVHSGVVEVRDNQVIMLADVAELADDIDVERARHALQEAEAKASSSDDDPEADAALRRAQVRIEVAAGA